MTETGEQVGEEDCLFMDITIPGGLDPKARKPVMIWIHGGSYVTGSGLGYLGAPIAVYGDVIVVTINYRLGIMGFLSNGNGRCFLLLSSALFHKYIKLIDGKKYPLKWRKFFMIG